MIRPLLASVALAASLLPFASLSQVPASQRAGFNLPPGQVVAPNTPGGGALIGSGFYSGDAANGFRHWKPADPANPDPVSSGFLVYDSDPSKSVGGSALCIFFCKVGQVAYDGNQTVYVASYDQAKGQPGSVTFPGVWRLNADPVTGSIQPAYLLVPNAGLPGNLPTSIALGPDGYLYVGFLKNGNVVRIVNPAVNPQDPVLGKTQVVQSVGTAPDGRPVRSLAFVGADLYLATSDSLAVIRNATAATCQGGCNGVRLSDGFPGVAHVGVTTDGVNRVYVSVANQVWRYTISSARMDLVSTGGFDPNTGVALNFAFVDGHSNLLQLDRLGNLWIGDDTSDGLFNFSGRIWSISSAALAAIP